MSAQITNKLGICLSVLAGLLTGLFVGFVFFFFWPVILRVAITLLITATGFLIGLGLFTEEKS